MEKIEWKIKDKDYWFVLHTLRKCAEYFEHKDEMDSVIQSPLYPKNKVIVLSPLHKKLDEAVYFLEEYITKKEL
jgi:hypothetical protein